MARRITPLRCRLPSIVGKAERQGEFEFGLKQLSAFPALGAGPVTRSGVHAFSTRSQLMVSVSIAMSFPLALKLGPSHLLGHAIEIPADLFGSGIVADALPIRFCGEVAR